MNNNGDKKEKDSTSGIEYDESWFADKWQQFIRAYRKTTFSYSTTYESDSEAEVEIDIEQEREIKRGYDIKQGHYYNYIIVDMFSTQSKTFVLDFRDLQNAISFGLGIEEVHVGTEKTITTEDLVSLENQVRNNPEATVRALKQAVYRIMKEAHHDYAMEIKDDFKARFKSAPDRIELSDITNKNIGKLYTFEGFVTAVDETTRLVYQKTMWQCKNNHTNEVHGQKKPFVCEYCNSHNLHLTNSVTDTYQEFRLQQRPDQTKDGRISVEREIVCIGSDIVNMVQGGDYVQISGIVKVRENTLSTGYRKKNTDVADFYIEASYIEKKPDDTMMILLDKDSLYLEDEVKTAVQPDTEDLGYQLLKMSVVPTVMGHDIEKEILLLQMASSDSRTFEDGTPHRGHICTLFCGSPSTAKSIMGRYVQKVHIRAIYPTGDGVSKAGLTAAVDTKTSPPRLYAGAYLMAKNGIVVIDELQALKDDILNVLLDAMEDAQTITITKAGIHRPLKADCASLHLCNPKTTAYWDDTKNIMENTGFKGNLLSRYDSIVVFRDIPDVETDTKIAEHWMKQFVRSTKDYERPKDVDFVTHRRKSPPTSSGLHSLPYMAMWLRYVRKTFHPTLKPDTEAYKIIQDFYLKMRKTDARFFAGSVPLEEEEESKQKIPSMTMRQLAALIRWAEASARAHHRNEVTVKDAEIACEIIRFCIVNSGFNPITKAAVATEIDANRANPQNAPVIKEIDIMRFRNLKNDRYYKESVRQFVKFETIVKNFGIGKCLYCKGKGIMTNVATARQKTCTECKGLGSSKLRFSMSDVEIALKAAGFTRSDVDYVADIFEKKGIIRRLPSGLYETVHEYDRTQGFGKIKLIDGTIEAIIDVDGHIRKAQEIADSLPEEERERINRKVQELSKRSDF
jgi:DNA replicative helicase MCM subunit Mcm2 (Cdc46/Mcm family)